ncbi:hypothetical protein EIN_031620 [Entamoeba invadens IP1]|uniref:TLDc domain-containing protein n=1 Tax=Entamoeba invadens IP1 TaxID=370355 RepID=A0A0A1U428_ENTIV|nr:hypothetical protein EIN_031620 [Entamoeba invadens IP1]ELP86441.1 hypothetical protein EIN_031620 [Entamoeba invadens IP1]|eukprot:XP_004185787.1 hypothetical protein EIN_031620 [Entamoeba invadens IP1]
MGNQSSASLQKGSLKDLLGKDFSNPYAVNLTVDSSLNSSHSSSLSSPRVRADSPKRKEVKTLVMSKSQKSTPRTPTNSTLKDSDIAKRRFSTLKKFKSSLNLSEQKDQKVETKRNALTPRVEDFLLDESANKTPRRKLLQMDFAREQRKSVQLSPRFDVAHMHVRKSIRTSAHLSFNLQFDYNKAQIEKVTSFIHSFGLNKCQLIFDSNQDELSARSFNSKVALCKSVFIIVTTREGHVLGCFQNGFLQVPSVFQCLRSKPDDFVLFGFGEHFSQGVSKRDLKDDTGLILYPKKEKSMVFTCHGAFWVMSDGKVYIQQNVSDIYDVNKQWENPLLNLKVQKFLVAESVLAFEFVE